MCAPFLIFWTQLNISFQQHNNLRTKDTSLLLQQTVRILLKHKICVYVYIFFRRNNKFNNLSVSSITGHYDDLLCLQIFSRAVTIVFQSGTIYWRTASTIAGIVWDTDSYEFHFGDGIIRASLEGKMQESVQQVAQNMRTMILQSA